MVARRLATRALSQTRRYLVGREEEVARLEQAVTADGEPPLFVTLFGAPGVGKTSVALAAHLRALVDQRQSIFLPASQVAPTPPGIGAALADLGLSNGFGGLGGGPLRSVLVIDGFEHIARMGDWLLSQLLSAAHDNLTVILTSRTSLAAQLAPYRMAVTWEERELLNLDAEASASLLTAAGVDARLHERAYAVTRGHPLALQLLASDPNQAEALDEAAQLPDSVIVPLAAHFRSDARDAAGGRALSAITVPRATDQALLGRLLGVDDAASTYDWLRSLPYVQETLNGLVPHDLIREVFNAELARRDSSLLRQYALRAVRHLIDAMDGLDPVEQHRLMVDGLYAMRNDLAVQLMADAEAIRGTWMDETTEEDDAWAQRTIDHFEGPAAAAAFAHYARNHPVAFVVRDEQPVPVGYLQFIPHDVPAAPVSDGATRRAMEIAAEHARVADRPVWVTRFLFARDTYREPSPSHGATLSRSALVGSITSPPVSLAINVTPSSPHWAHLAESSPVTYLEQQTYDGRGYTFWLFDVTRGDPHADPEEISRRATPTWLAMMAGIDVNERRSAGRRCQLTSKEVRLALGVFYEPHRLAVTRLAEIVGGSDPVSESRRWVTMCIEQMAGSPAHADLASILQATYIEPAVKQRAAAVELKLPWGTYRHRLDKAIDVLRNELEMALRGR